MPRPRADPHSPSRHRPGSIMKDQSGPEETPSSEVGRRSVHAVKWGAASTMGLYALQLVAQVTLARILGPEVYGVFGLGLVVYTFTRLVGSFGFGWVLMQLKDLSPQDVRFAFTWQLVAAFLAAGAMLLSASLLAEFFNEPGVESVVRWLAVAMVLEAASSVPGYLLKRRLDFKTTGLIDVSGYFVGYIVVGIPAALLGFGVNALVAAWLVQSALKALGYYWKAPHDLRPLFRPPAGGGEIVGMGATVFVTNVVNWLLTNLDRVVLGRVLNATAVGWYTAAFNLARTPNGLLIISVQPAFFAAGARVQDEPLRIRRAYQEVFGSLLVLAAPMMCFLSAIGPDLVRFLYGEAWGPAGAALRVLFLAMLAHLLLAMSTPVLWNTGRRNLEALLQAPMIFFSVPLLYVSASYGVVGVAWAIVLVFCVRALLVGGAACRAVNLGIRDLAPDLTRGFLLSILAVGAAFTAFLLTPVGSQSLWRLVSASLATATTLGLLVYWRPSVLGPNALKILRRFLPEALHARASMGGKE